MGGKASEQEPRGSVYSVPRRLREPSGFEPGASAGLFVGIREFRDKRFAEVPYAVDDAVDLAHLFAFELDLVKPEKVVLCLVGEPKKGDSQARLKILAEAGAVRRPATQDEIYDQIEAQGRKTGRAGLFVVSLATHGFSDQGSDFLVAVNTLRRRVQRTGIAVDELFDDVSRSRATRRLVFLDACRERLSCETRAGGVDSESAMGQAFADAITDAEGQVILSASSLGGYSYDDHELENGVFTAAVIDGLRGKARADEKGLITVQSVADYVNRRVLVWVETHRKDHAKLSRGISQRLEGAAASMPLAVDPAALALEAAARKALAEFQRRRGEALTRLASNLPGGVISGQTFDEIQRALDTARPTAAHRSLLEEVEALDGSARLQRNLVFYFEQHRGDLEQEPPATGIATAGKSAGRRRAGRDSEPQAGDVWEDPVLGIRFRYAPPGTFTMGSPETEAGRFYDETQHEVTLSRGFWIGETAVTQGQFERFVKATGYRTEAEREGYSRAWNGGKWGDVKGVTWRDSGGDRHPVANVSWYDARMFCEWLRQETGEPIRLPTGAEWEYAARAGTSTATYAGDSTPSNKTAPELEKIAWYSGNSGMSAHPVGRKEANDWGLHDMLGNLWEWCEDSWDGQQPYGAQTVQDPRGTVGPRRVIRGGSWGMDARYVRAAARVAEKPGIRNHVLGFRLARGQSAPGRSPGQGAGKAKVE